MKISLCLMGSLICGLLICACSEKLKTEEKQNKVVDPVAEIIRHKLRTIIIPRIDFEDRSVEEAINFIRLRSVEVESPDPDSTMRGVSMVIRRSRNVPAPELSKHAKEDLLGDPMTSARIPELRLRNVSVTAALRYICIITNMKCEVSEKALDISSKNPKTAWNDVGSLLEVEGDKTVISTKLAQIRIPRVDFENISIHEAIDFLRLKSAEMHLTEVDSSKKGINYVVYMPSGVTIPCIDKLSMQDATVEEVLKQICVKTGMRYEVEPYAVILVPRDLK